MRFLVTSVALAAGLVLLASGAALASPVGGYVLWLDASDTSTITSTAGLVDQWRDKSASLNHFNASGNQRPTTGATQNGLNLITLDGGDDWMTGPTGVLGAGDDDYTYYAVWRPHKNATMAVYEQGQGTNQRSSILTTGADYGFNGQNNDAHDMVLYGPNQWRVTDMLVDNSLPDGTNNIYLTDNDTDYKDRTGNPANLAIGANGTRVGAKVQNNGERFDGDVAEILVYPDALTPAQRLEVRDYLDAKWALNDQDPNIYWDFEDDASPGTPSLDGWTIIAQSNGNNDVPYLQPEESEANRMTTEPCLTTAWDLPDGSAGGFRGDNAHDILIARSPSFEITAAGEITFDSVGGHPGNGQDPGLGTDPYAGGAMGVSLVRASNHYRVMSTETTQNGGVTGYSFDISSLLNDGNLYYLEVVDNLSGGWGYVEWDNFFVPQAADTGIIPEPSTCLIWSLGLLGAAVWTGRRRARR